MSVMSYEVMDLELHTLLYTSCIYMYTYMYMYMYIDVYTLGRRIVGVHGMISSISTYIHVHVHVTFSHTLFTPRSHFNVVVSLPTLFPQLRLLLVASWPIDCLTTSQTPRWTTLTYPLLCSVILPSVPWV